MQKNDPSSASHLQRVLGPWTAIAIVIGTVIGSGVFKKPFEVAKNVPDFGLAISAWVLVGLLAMFGALVLAEVATLLPRAGGNYVYLRESYGRLFGFLWGWTDFWMIRSGSIAALAWIFSESVHDIIRQARDLPAGATVFSFWELQALTIAVIMALAFVNVLGVRWGGLLQFLITLVKVSSLIGVILLPFLVLGFTNNPKNPPSLANITPAWPSDWGRFEWGKYGAAMVAVIWAYHGWMNIGPVAEEIKNPQRNLPVALIVGVTTLILLYVGANVAYYLVIPQPDIVKLSNTAVATEFSIRLLGRVGGIITAAAIGISVFGALNGNILVGPRILYAMGEDGMLPRWFGRLHPRWSTPVVATIVEAVWSALLLVIVGAAYQMGKFGPPEDPTTKAPFDITTDYAMFGAVALDTLAVMSIFILRIKRPDAPRPYRCLGYPIVPATYGLIMLAVWINMFQTQPKEAKFGLVFIALGIAVFGAFLWRQGGPSLREGFSSASTKENPSRSEGLP
jgi:basic amino acid/polyamine antiporter, APA family